VSALPAPFVTRDARELDLDAITELERRSFPVPWKRDYFAVEVGAPHRFNRVVRDGRGELAGYVFCVFAGGEVHVNKIAVSERWRRTGIASHLMREVLQLAQTVEAVDIYLEVRVSNLAARNFYERLGFSQAGRRTSYYLDGEDALVMVLNLDAPRPVRQTRGGVRTLLRR